MKQNRPTNIGLGSIVGYKFPITAISSILHRITGILMLIGLPFLIWAFDASLSSQEGFKCVKSYLTGSVSFLTWGYLSVFSYHVIAGIRHLLMDIGIGEEMNVAKTTSYITIGLSIVAAVWWGIWLWLLV
jgi:succinate dehydrogenase / fumarate reductase cytochrome b subunit